MYYNNTNNNDKLKIYVDLIFAGDNNSRKSTSGYVVFIGMDLQVGVQS